MLSLIPLFIVSGLLVLQMIFSVIGNLKKYKSNVLVQTWMFKLVKFTSMVTYGPLYRNLLQVSMVFGSNFKKKKSKPSNVLSFSKHRHVKRHIDRRLFIEIKVFSILIILTSISKSLNKLGLYLYINGTSIIMIIR